MINIVLVVTIIALVALVGYVIWLRHQLRNVILTNNGLYKTLLKERELIDDLKMSLDVKTDAIAAFELIREEDKAKRSTVEQLVAESNLTPAEKINIITVLK